MNSRILQIALRIALIKEEFSESDILEAVQLLEDQGTASALLAYLAGRGVPSPTEKTKGGGRRTKPVDEQRSKAVIDLQSRDPIKYQVLSEFDVLVRKGNVLPEMEDIRRLGERLSKRFKPTKSRREAIGRLMAVIAERPIDDIRDIVATALSSGNVDDKSSEYHELAQFIIRGKTSQAKGE